MGGSVDTEPCPLTAVARVKVGTKTAVTDLLASITRLVGVTEPLRSPVQFTKAQPGAGLALIRTASPLP